MQKGVSGCNAGGVPINGVAASDRPAGAERGKRKRGRPRSRINRKRWAHRRVGEAAVVVEGLIAAARENCCRRRAL
jgi:hypothetical protein